MPLVAGLQVRHSIPLIDIGQGRPVDQFAPELILDLVAALGQGVLLPTSKHGGA